MKLFSKAFVISLEGPSIEDKKSYLKIYESVLKEYAPGGKRYVEFLKRYGYKFANMEYKDYLAKVNRRRKEVGDEPLPSKLDKE